ncbi:hypothetical protein HZS_3082 [Henneguya salminicola]|nr:hypothetical protein HZS_3082 [Henneguya salminicola]
MAVDTRKKTIPKYKIKSLEKFFQTMKLQIFTIPVLFEHLRRSIRLQYRKEPSRDISKYETTTGCSQILLRRNLELCSGFRQNAIELMAYTEESFKEITLKPRWDYE